MFNVKEVNFNETEKTVYRKTPKKDMFNNAKKGSEAKLFTGLNELQVPFERQEVKPEAPKVDPFASLHEKNKMQLEAYSLAQKSTSDQILVKPGNVQQSEFVTLDELPAAVKQAAEAAAQNILKKQAKKRK